VGDGFHSVLVFNGSGVGRGGWRGLRRCAPFAELAVGCARRFNGARQDWFYLLAGLASRCAGSSELAS
jgi:hypothetical protein